MKTHTIKTPTAELLILETPEGCEYSKDLQAIIGYQIMNDIPKRYTLLGKPDEIREDDAKELVESKPIFGEEYRGMYYVYPKESKLFTASSVLSLLSLLETEIYWNNPIPKPDNYNLWSKYGDFTQYGVRLTKECNGWNEAEQKTFDRKRTLIFKKNKTNRRFYDQRVL